MLRSTVLEPKPNKAYVSIMISAQEMCSEQRPDNFRQEGISYVITVIIFAYLNYAPGNQHEPTKNRAAEKEWFSWDVG